MSRENVELVRRGTESADAFWALLDQDVVWDMSAMPLLDLPGRVLGRDSVIEATRHYWGTWEDYSLDVKELIDAGSSVVLVVHEQGHGRGSGVPFEHDFAQVWTFDRGKVIRWGLFPSKADALEDIGLSE